MNDPFDVTGTETPGPDGAMPSQFYNNLLSFGAATMAAANQRTPQGFLANGSGPLGPLGVGLQAGIGNAAQMAQARASLAHTGAETQNLLGTNELQKMNLQFMKGRLGFMNQYMSGMPGGGQPLADNTNVPSAGPAPDKYATATPPPGPMADVVSQAANRYGVPLAVATWVGSHESGWNPNAPAGWDPKDIGGAWQFKPATAAQYNVADRTDFAQSTDGAMRYLRDLAIRNNGDWGKVVDQYGTTSTGKGADADNAVRQGFQTYLNRVGLAPQAAAVTPSQKGATPIANAAPDATSSAANTAGFGALTGAAPYQVAQAGNGPLPTPGHQAQQSQQPTPQSRETNSQLGSVMPPGMYTPQQALQMAQQADAQGDRAAMGAMWGVPGADVEAQNQRQRAQQYRDYAQRFTLQLAQPQSIRGPGSANITMDPATGQQKVIQSPEYKDVLGPDNRMYQITQNAIETGTPYVRPPGVPEWAPAGTLTITPQKLAPGEEEIQKETAADAFGADARKKYNSASGTLRSLEDMETQFNNLNTSSAPGWYNTGEGAGWRLTLGKAINAATQVTGAPPIFDIDKLASGEDIMKQSKLLGMDVLSSHFGGSKEAASIVTSTQNAVPGVENTPLGGKLLLSGFKEAAREQMDEHAFNTQWAVDHHGNMLGSDVAFKQTRAPAMYTRRAISAVRPYEVSDPGEFKRYLPGTQIYLKGTDPKNPANIRTIPGTEDIQLVVPPSTGSPNGPG